MPEPRRWFYLFIATLSQTAMSTIHMGLPTVVPLIQAELGLNLTEVGVLVSMINVGVVAAVLGMGKAADRYGERRIIGYGTAACGLLVLTVHFAGSFIALLVVFLLLGVPVATSTPAGSKAVAGWFPDRERGMAMGVRQTGIPAGGTIGALTLPAMGLVFGWRWALSLVGVVTIAAGLLVLVCYKEPARPPGGERRRSRGRAEGHCPALGDLGRRVLRRGAGRVPVVLHQLHRALPDREHVLPAGVRRPPAGGGQACGGTGRIVFGIASDRLFFGRRVPVLVMLGVLGTVAGVATALLSPGLPPWLVAVVVSLLGFGTMSWQGLYLALVAKIAGTRVAGVAIGLTNTVAFVGVVLLPPVFGAIADYTHSYQTAWIAMAVAIALPLPFLWRVREDSLDRGSDSVR